MRKILILTVSSILATLLLLEVLIRLLYPRFSSYQTEMFRYAAEHKMLTANPKLPFRHVPSKTGTYYGIEIKTNAVGFRDKDYDLTKPAGTKRILIAGDSV